MGSQTGSSEVSEANVWIWTLIEDARHYERPLTVSVDHYNSHRPHRSVDLAPELTVVMKRTR